jgi:hypothetical protein
MVASGRAAACRLPCLRTLGEGVDLNSGFISLAPAAGSRVSEAATVQEDNALGVLCGIV